MRFLEEGLEHAKKLGKDFGFTPNYFMLKIDKFFAKEKMVVLLPKDNEYENYLAQ